MTEPQNNDGSSSLEIRRYLVSDQPKTQLYRLGKHGVLAISWITESTGSCISVTHAWCEFTGRSRENSLGDGWLRCIHPLDVQRVETALQKAQTLHRSLCLEYRLRRADGTYGWVQHDGTPQLDDAGIFEGFVHVAIDLVGIKRLEENLLEKQAELRQQRELAQGLLDLMMLMNIYQSTPAMLEFLLDQVVHMLDAQIGILFYLSADQRSLQVQATTGLAAEIAQGMGVLLGEGTAGRAAQQRRTIALDAIEVEALERILHCQPHLWERVISLTQTVARSLAAPILVQNQLLGVLAVYRRESNTFSQDEIDLLTALGVQAGLIIQSERSQKNATQPLIYNSSTLSPTVTSVASEHSMLALEH